MAYYRESIRRIRQCLEYHFEGEPARDPGGKMTMPHLLWMAQEIERFGAWSWKDAAKAARWIGWMFAAMERLNEERQFQDESTWTNLDSRNAARIDARAGMGVPKPWRWFR